MKILQISPQVPFPLDNGGRIGIYGIAKYLANRGHEIDFVCYRKETDYNYAYNELSLFSKPEILDVQTENNPVKALLNLFSDVPYNISKFFSVELEQFLRKYFKNNNPDIIHIDHLHMGWCISILRELTNAPIALREHNLEYKIMQRYSEKAHNPLIKKYSDIQFRKLKKYEISLCEKFDLCTMVSEEDESVLKCLNPKTKTLTIPAGVSSSLLDLQCSKILPFTIAHIGDMSWLPNYDGLTWYLNEVFPEVIKKIPQIMLYLYGKGNENLKIPEFLKHNITVVGYVKNIWDQLLDKQLCIVPLRVGSGIRIKILEMMAAGKSILSTSIGKEGIQVNDMNEILIADGPAEFIDKTVKFFDGKFDTKIMTEKSKDFVRENYIWEVISGKFEKAYLDLLV
ncbi:MAG: glycosyltransferase family 4 protein [Bacteroidota bacterium]|nr:glycosyltransferase family 4 protein [Bacteroidota bacterium]